MNEIIEILMARDGISKEDAIDVIDNCKEEIDYILLNNGSYDDAEEALKYWLGLEPDYLDIFLDM